MIYFVFDILELEGFDLRKVELGERKKILKKRVGEDDSQNKSMVQNQNVQK